MDEFILGACIIVIVNIVAARLPTIAAIPGVNRSSSQVPAAPSVEGSGKQLGFARVYIWCNEEGTAPIPGPEPPSTGLVCRDFLLPYRRKEQSHSWADTSLGCFRDLNTLFSSAAARPGYICWLPSLLMWFVLIGPRGLLPSDE